LCFFIIPRLPLLPVFNVTLTYKNRTVGILVKYRLSGILIL